MHFLLAAAVIIPILAWSPSLIDDARLDGGIISLISFALLAWRPSTSTRGTLLFAAAISCSLIPLFATNAPVLGGIADRAPIVAGWALMVFAIQNQSALNKTWTPILGAIFVASIYALLQIIGIDPLGWQPPGGGPPVVPFSGTNHGAEILVPAILAALALGWSGKANLFLIPAAFLLGWWNVLAAMISLPVGLLLLLKSRQSSQLINRASIALVAVSFVIGHFASTPPTNTAEFQTSVSEQAAKNTGQKLPTSIAVRWTTDTHAIKHAATTPLGIGLGRYENDHPAWMPPELLEIASRNFQDQATPRAKDPHNEPLLVLLEAGWLGLLLWLSAIYFVMKRPGRAVWTNPALVAVAIHSLVRSPLADNGIALAFIFLLLAADKEAITETKTNWVSILKKPSWKYLPPITMAGLAACFALPNILGEYHLSKALKQGERANASLVAALDPLDKALYWRPWNSLTWSLQAASLSHHQAPIKHIRYALQQAITYDPANLFAHTALIKLEMSLVESSGEGNEILALASIATCENLAPRHPATLEARTLWLELQAKRQRAKANDLLSSNPQLAGPRFFAAHCFEALAQLRRGQTESASKSIRAAAVYAEDKTALLNRLARSNDLQFNDLREVILNIAPDWELYLGPEVSF